MDYMSAEFGVDSTCHFSLLEHERTDRQLHYLSCRTCMYVTKFCVNAVIGLAPYLICSSTGDHQNQEFVLY